MDRLAPFFHRLYLETPWCYLSWPTAAMVIGTLLAAVSAALATRLAVVPRQASGLLGILTAPFVHANAAHLAANLPPFLVLGGLVLRRNETRFVEVAASIAIAGGLLLWLFGRRLAHVGMSGVIFGFFGYLLALAWFARSPGDLLVAGGVLLVYGGMVAGLKPVREKVSWESHLFGLAAGIARAWFDTH